MDLPLTLDMRDVVYGVVGLALVALTLEPIISKIRWMNLPVLHVALGWVLAAVVGFPVISPLAGGLQTKIVEHATELIVIISLAGAGLAIDTEFSFRKFLPVTRLLVIAMPLTIAAVWWMGQVWVGLPVAAAALLAASLAPTDPVLARAVQVSPPNQGETQMQMALTGEAGLNDGLAFPFVYLAIGLASYGLADLGWLRDWALIEVLWRVGAGVGMGVLCGLSISNFAYSRFGDASHGAWNSIVMVLGATLLSYGLTEAIDGYGFLACFVCARTGRQSAKRRGDDSYEKFVHHGADQLESILLVLLLIWFGMFLGSGALSGLTWTEAGLAAALIFVIRPVAGWLALLGHRCTGVERGKVAFFGVRGMGSIFYIAYAQTHADFAEIDVVWRIAAFVILVSIFIHGFGASMFVGDGEDEEEHPFRRNEG